MSAKKTHPARGMRDFDAATKRRRNQAMAIIASTFRAHGFSEIETPAMEPIERLTSGQGGDNEKMLFRILRRGLEAPTSLDELCDLGLRYDLTVPLARFYATHHAELPRVVRCIQIGPVWRAERPQKGRFRQFTQCDIDILGEAGPTAEVELIAATLQALRALGLSEMTLRLNDRRLLSYLLLQAGVDDEAAAGALITIDKLDKIGIDKVLAELTESCSAESAEKIGVWLRDPAAVESLLESDDAKGWLGALQAVAEAVRPGADGIEIRLDPTLVRGMGYYTGPIFEVELAGASGSIAGGGRYDEMIGRFLKRPVPACGFSIGFERVVDLAQLDDADGRSRAALVYDKEVAWDRMLEAKGELIERGFDVQTIARSKHTGKELKALEADGPIEVFRLEADGSWR